MAGEPGRSTKKQKMLKLYSPETELDLAFIKSLLESEKIQFFVHNDHYGSLNLGPKIDLVNAKTIFVNESDAVKAKEIIDNYLRSHENETNESQEKSTYSWATKLRMIFEALIFTWFIPQGRRWKKRNKK